MIGGIRIGRVVAAMAVALVAAGSSSAYAQATPGVSQRAFARDGGWNQSYSRGMELYAENCAACHGDSGRGDYGLPLNLQSFLRIADIDYLISSIRHGRPIRGMPAFGDEGMSADDMRAIALFIKSWQYEPSIELPAGPITGDLDEGRALFEGLCTGCHGLSGEGGPNVGGGHVIGAVSGIGGPALADPGFLMSATDAYIKATLMYGRVGTPMGAYLKGRQGFVELREEEINSIVVYLRSLLTEG
jgi:cytochrome c oxidase cbb3-type subunit 3